MTAPMTFESFLNGEEGLAALLPKAHNRYRTKSTRKPIVYRLKAAMPGENSFRNIWAPPPHETPGNEAMLLEEIRKVVTEKYGGNPSLRLQFQCWVDGQSKDPLLTMTRTLEPGDGWSTDPNIALLQAELSRSQARIFTLEEQNGKLTEIVASLAGNLGNQLATTAAARTATGAAGDIGPVGWISLLVIVAAAPFMLRLFGIPDKLPVGMQLKLLFAKIQGQFAVAAGEPPPTPQIEQDGPDGPGDDDDRQDAVRKVLTDQALQAELLAEIQKRPQVMQAMLAQIASSPEAQAMLASLAGLETPVRS